jgi:hypothetical protein
VAEKHFAQMPSRRLTLADLPTRYQKQVAAAYEGQGGAALPQKQAQNPRLRQKAGDGLNKTERAFLEHLKADPEYDRVLPHAITLKLANGCRYTPDFIAYHSAVDTFGDTDQIYAFEVKGFMRDDAAVKLKVAAAQYGWMFSFHLVTKLPRGAGWDIQPILP